MLSSRNRHIHRSRAAKARRTRPWLEELEAKLMCHGGAAAPILAGGHPGRITQLSAAEQRKLAVQAEINSETPVSADDGMLTSELGILPAVGPAVANYFQTNDPLAYYLLGHSLELLPSPINLNNQSAANREAYRAFLAEIQGSPDFKVLVSQLSNAVKEYPANTTISPQLLQGGFTFGINTDLSLALHGVSVTFQGTKDSHGSTTLTVTISDTYNFQQQYLNGSPKHDAGVLLNNQIGLPLQNMGLIRNYGFSATFTVTIPGTAPAKKAPTKVPAPTAPPAKKSSEQVASSASPVNNSGTPSAAAEALYLYLLETGGFGKSSGETSHGSNAIDFIFGGIGAAVDVGDDLLGGLFG